MFHRKRLRPTTSPAPGRVLLSKVERLPEGRAPVQSMRAATIQSSEKRELTTAPKRLTGMLQQAWEYRRGRPWRTAICYEASRQPHRAFAEFSRRRCQVSVVSVSYRLKQFEFLEGFKWIKKISSDFSGSRKGKPPIPQNRGEPTKTVTVKVTKSVVLTGRREQCHILIGRGCSSLTGLETKQIALKKHSLGHSKIS